MLSASAQAEQELTERLSLFPLRSPVRKQRRSDEKKPKPFFGWLQNYSEMIARRPRLNGTTGFAADRRGALGSTQRLVDVTCDGA
jgi:hypothetical protein